MLVKGRLYVLIIVVSLIIIDEGESNGYFDKEFEKFFVWLVFMFEILIFFVNCFIFFW